ncbi:zinc-dependent metalloprotease [Hymenobacter sp. BRD128]|uniref:zinc-dependent metalloprotease n=1 Tax=Hymenobacter sp. BRD128 TaxID=2675878 RepID=UPI0015658C08|nr:zinc-dependent metalloprotease [Hymenobacter sp. BRD128]QKG56611.1 zinc-dependent metalloprotease [Hymenobacter sp. BRD128]
MKHALLFSASLLAASQLATAQTSAPGTASPAPRAEARPAASLSAITQGLKKFDGYFPFYYDDKTGKVYLEVSRFDQEFLYFSSLPSGVGLGGPERGAATSSLAKFVKVGPKVLLLEPNYAYRASGQNPDEQRAVESAFAKSVIWGFAPVAVEGDKVLLDLTPFLVRDSQKLTDQLGKRSFAGLRGGAGGPAPAPYRFDETRSAVYPDNTKNFPKNTEFEALVTFVGGPSAGGNDFGFGSPGLAPDPNAVTVRMHQSFVELPPPGFKPREFDPRSGFFPFSYLDFSVPMTEPLTQRFSRRHRLAKKNPGAQISDPVAPIVYYVDRGAPPDIKRALIEGGSWWNQAFEAAGYRNAFIVKELPEGADPMDIRYNVVNWVDRAGNPRAFSFGSSYIDPRTGEIIKGVVTLGSDRHRQDYLIAEGLLQPYKNGRKAPKELEDLALARIRQLSAHEIGHTLGLYHNFTSSTHERGSVMDYPFPRFSLRADGSIDVSQAYATGIGSWDKRAILWGYQDFPKGTDESAALNKIMRETLQQGHIFIPDIGGYAHPLANQWDDGENAVTQLTKLMAVRRHVLDTFSADALPAGAPLATLEEVLVPMYLLHRYQVEAAAKSLGGLYFTHAVKDDGQVITRMVEPAEQWRAFDALLATVTPAALALPEKLIQQIPPRPAGYPSSLETFAGHTGPTFDPLAAAEAAAAPTIAALLSPERAARLVEYQARDARQPGFMPVVDKLLAQTWQAPLAPGYPGELQIVVNNLTLKQLLQLAATPDLSEGVRGQSLLKITELQAWMKNHLNAAEPRQKANLLFGLAQISKFEDDPNKFTPAPALEMPPGAPIGLPALDFLGDDQAY